MPEHDNKEYQFAISLSVLNHLGRNLYRNFVTVLGEAISNSWDADATNVWIDIDRENNKFLIADDGVGMTSDEFENRFLKIGYSKRKEGGEQSAKGRPYIGAKGIGKLALLSCADRISIFTHTADTPYTGGVIDNSDLDAAIKNDLIPDDYPLEQLDFNLIDGLFKNDENGTTIVFEGADRVLNNSEEYIRKILALSFQFSLIDPDFTIHVNDVAITVDDLSDLAKSTQFLWNINGHESAFLDSIEELAEPVQELTTELPISGYVGSVVLPRNLKIIGMDERVTIDLFVNGRIREKNVIRHVPTQRVVESYIYGQIHFNSLDREGSDPFTSSREGVVESDERFQALLQYLKRELLPKVFDVWDKLRLKIGKEGDDENKRKSKKQRKAANLVEAAEEEITEGLPPAQADIVDGWIAELRPDAEFNVEAYVDCFLSENVVRKFLEHSGTPLTGPSQKLADDWKKIEAKRKEEANINFDIRKDDIPASYLSMDELAISAEGGKNVEGKPTPMFLAAIAFRPVRNAVGHTGLLTEVAKNHLNVTFQNINGRVKNLLSGMKTDS